jgi:hypothetical protein
VVAVALAVELAQIVGSIPAEITVAESAFHTGLQSLSIESHRQRNWLSSASCGGAAFLLFIVVGLEG